MTVGTLERMRQLNENKEWMRRRDIYVLDMQAIQKHTNDTITNYHDLIYSTIDDVEISNYLVRMFCGRWDEIEYGFDGKFGKVEV